MVKLETQQRSKVAGTDKRLRAMTIRGRPRSLKASKGAAHPDTQYSKNQSTHVPSLWLKPTILPELRIFVSCLGRFLPLSLDMPGELHEGVGTCWH